jgi:hypothetical protein
MLLKWTLITIAALGLVSPAMAGPPYVSDDPEPTDYRHFEIYTFSNGTATRGTSVGRLELISITGLRRISN